MTNAKMQTSIGKVNKLDVLLNQSVGNRMSQIEWEYWLEIAVEFLSRYDVELGIGGAYNGHLAILLRECYEKGKNEPPKQELDKKGALD